MKAAPWIAAAALLLAPACASSPEEAQAPPQPMPIDEASEDDIDAQIDAIISEIEAATDTLNATFDGFYEGPDLEQVGALIDEVERLAGLVGVAHNRLLTLDPDVGFRLQVLYSKGEFYQFLSEDLGAIPLPPDAPEEALVAAEERLALLMFDFDQLALDTFYEIDQLATENQRSDQVVELARSAIPNLEERIAAVTDAIQDDPEDADAVAEPEDPPPADPGDGSWFEANPEVDPESDPEADPEADPEVPSADETWFD